MKYENIKKGNFVSRPNRFIAKVIVDGKEETVHVKNTGRCKELLTPNASVILEESNNLNRKTKYSLISIYKGNVLINMDSQSPNKIVYDALEKGDIAEIGMVDFIKREVTYSKSRFDIYFEKGSKKGFIEVKGVTLEVSGVAKFPDAPTERGAKHINELIQAKKEGFEAYILFLVQMKGPNKFVPNNETDPNFAKTLKLAKENGVGILCYDCVVNEDVVILDKPINSYI